MIRTLVIGTVLAAGAVLAAWLLDLFTLAGLAYAFLPWADGATLRWPLGTRLVWWGLLLEAGVAVVAALVWREGRLECPTRRDLWLAAHVSLVQRVYRRTVFAVEGARVALEQHHRHRPTTVEEPATATDGQRDVARTDRAA